MFVTLVICESFSNGDVINCLLYSLMMSDLGMFTIPCSMELKARHKCMKFNMKIEALMFFALFLKMTSSFLEKFDDVRSYLIVYNSIHDWITGMSNEEHITQNEALSDVKDVKPERSPRKYVND